MFKDLTDKQLQLYCRSFEHFLDQKLARFKPDIVECQHIWIMDHIVGQKNVPYVVTAHHSDQLGFLQDQRVGSIIKRYCHHIPHIIAISQYVKDEIIQLYEIDSDRIHIIPNGVDMHTFCPFEVDRQALLEMLELNIPPEAKIVTCVAKLSHTKGIDVLLRASQILQQEQNVHFIIMGSGDVDEFLVKNNIGNDIFQYAHFIGHQTGNMVAKIHNIADLSVIASRSEGFCLAGLEAMSCGLPLVTTRCGGPEHYTVGDIVDVNNPQALAHSILGILNLNPVQYQNLCKQALEAAQGYSWDKLIKQRLELYEHVIAEFGQDPKMTSIQKLL